MIKLARQLIRILDRATDVVLYVILFSALLLGAFSLWEARQTYGAADTGAYTAYRPEGEDMGRFRELRAINPEVIAWLRIDGMPVDYPVTQANDNEKYLNTGAEGQFTLSGSLFLDYRNSPDFSDFNSVVYGHDMEKRRMFGSLREFADPGVLEEHSRGSLFFQDREHSVEFFALVLTDAYDAVLYSLDVPHEERAAYIAGVLDKAVAVRDCAVSGEDRLVLLSTCTEEITNGRYVLMGKLTGESAAAEAAQGESGPEKESGSGRVTAVRLNALPLWFWCACLAALLLLLRFTGRSGRRG